MYLASSIATSVARLSGLLDDSLSSVLAFHWAIVIDVVFLLADFSLSTEAEVEQGGHC